MISMPNNSISKKINKTTKTLNNNRIRGVLDLMMVLLLVVCLVGISLMRRRIIEFLIRI